MPSVDLVVTADVPLSPRVLQLGAMFDVPLREATSIEWKGEFPYDAEPWDVGLIVGPSGSGKSTLGRAFFGAMPPLEWDPQRAVIDDFVGSSIQEITDTFSAVGFNTIPAWMRPYSKLSNGEQFRADVARRLLELPAPVFLDEFTSVVDRQVAKIGAHAVQKYARKHRKPVVAASCHYDIIDWLQPDWILEPATMSFSRRALQRRPELHCTIQRVAYAAWPLFAPYHYLTAKLNSQAVCFGLSVGGRLASFAGVLHRPHPVVNDIKGVSRLVTLPDWQGLGLAMVLVDTLGSAYAACGKRLHTYPAHPALTRTFDRSPHWALQRRPGTFSVVPRKPTLSGGETFGNRPNAVFAYRGPHLARELAEQLLSVATRQ